MKKVWRLLDTGKQSAAYNMALERVILTARSRGMVPDTIHFLEFSPHCALIGYHQAVNLEVEEEYCKEHGIDINRRISGGGNLYMDEGQLGWEIFALKDTPGIPRRLEDMYSLLCEAAIAGLSRLGVQARFRPHNDIEVGGRKISGTGGTEMGNSILYHGTILTDFDVDTMIACLKLPLKKLENKQVQSFKERVTCLREVLGYVPPMKDIKKAMAEGFAEVLGVELKPSGLSDFEQSLLDQELPLFQSDEWIRGSRPSQGSQLQVVDYKSPGGLIRVSLRLDPQRKRIKYVFITGDFFAYPERSILDLEAALKNSSSQPDDLLFNVRRFLGDHNVIIPGVTSEDIFQAVWTAIERVEG
ncbi:MAG TPA: biotin/lipoate A/B protein ligase family protein [Syntrophomonadaceae bacterium]|nr:biotin/lipoate A/B protein ligase family protein [Syntrophomonadaceae bacterium]